VQAARRETHWFQDTGERCLLLLLLLLLLLRVGSTWLAAGLWLVCLLVLPLCWVGATCHTHA
jgi:hypothetical protein